MVVTMNKTVFISSTYDDLKEYRRAVWELLEKFDVNVRGMEQFGARKEAALATCLAEVEQSDILSWRHSVSIGLHRSAKREIIYPD